MKYESYLERLIIERKKGHDHENMLTKPQIKVVYTDLRCKFHIGLTHLPLPMGEVVRCLAVAP